MSEIIASTYEIIEKIGFGGGGNVFLANHLRLNKKVALKADKRTLKTRPELLRREVDILKNLSHSYIPQVYDFFVEDEIVYTVMDFIEGESLDKALKRGERFSQSQIIVWAKQLLEALTYLHSPTHGTPAKGFVHSDIKPANLMRTSNGNICLIDFNIALALGEETVVGCSAGYASPEHYGLDFSTESGTATAEEEKTLTILEEEITVTIGTLQSNSSNKKVVVPDVRSDIYSVGATLYHLLSGKRPARHVLEVTPLSEKEFSPLLVRIISKAMNANPDLRYQTAEEMLWDLQNLHKNDPRTKKLKMMNRISYSVLGLFFAVGLALMFVGLKRIQVTEHWQNLAQSSKEASEDGDNFKAVQYALEIFTGEENLLTPKRIPEATEVLTSALGVYDLAEGYRADQVMELPACPIYMEISPNGKTAACICESTVVIFDTSAAEVLCVLPAENSVMAEVTYLDDTHIVYSGSEGVCVYDIENQKEVWTGNKGTGITVSQDQSTIAAVYDKEPFATVYDVETGEVKQQVDFYGKSQEVTMVSENFANPNHNLFELNSDGTKLAVSFQDGSLEIFQLGNAKEDMILLGKDSGYIHFEGGFYEDYCTFSAFDGEKSLFAIIDTERSVQTAGFATNSYLSTRTEQSGIYLMSGNALVQIDPTNGQQTSLNDTADKIYRYALDDRHIAAAAQERVLFYDHQANVMTTLETEEAFDFLQMKEGVALLGSLDSPKVKIMRYEENADKEVATYDSAYEHKETRISNDGKTIMYFSYKQFRVCDMSGEIIEEVSLPNPEKVYDQEFIREEDSSYLKVTYNDGTILEYSAKDGSLMTEKKTEAPEMSLDTVFYTDLYQFEVPLREKTKVYKRESGKLVCELEEDAYLTYVTQAGEYIVIQYMTTDGICYGKLLNDRCEEIANLPYLCDVMGKELYFDYPTGEVKKIQIFDIEELLQMAEEIVEKE